MLERRFKYPLTSACLICGEVIGRNFSLCNECNEKVDFLDEVTDSYHMKNGKIIPTTEQHWSCNEQAEEIAQTFVKLLEQIDDWKFNIKIKERGFEHEKRTRMRGVLQRNIDEYTERIENNTVLVNEYLEKYDFLEEIKEIYEAGYIGRNDKVIVCVFCHKEKCVC